MEQILKSHRLFEVNTGAMARLGNAEPYPSAYLLKELQKRGGEVILSSDCHSTEALCYKFGEVRELLKACGFRYVKRLTRGGFVDDAL
jgi:histidinol-phosphatase (PHP family)